MVDKSTKVNFLAQLQSNSTYHIVDFVKIWYHYDANRNGLLERNELKAFLHDLLKIKEDNLTAKKLEEYVDYILENYDRNQDGKIELGELSKILNVEDNFLARFQDGDLTKEQFEEVFAHYDKVDIYVFFFTQYLSTAGTIIYPE